MTKQKFSIKSGIQDERFPKLMGLLCLFFALYFFIAYTSYLFTWKADQDYANLSILFENNRINEVQNWLGRLGAIISHYSFYWGFGLSSYIIVFLLFSSGMNLIFGNELKKILPVYKHSLSTMLWSSFLLAFVFQSFAFPFGGALGKALVEQLNNLVGFIGTAVILLFIVFAYIVWNKNPKFEEWNKEEVLKAFSKTNLKKALRSFFKLIPTDMSFIYKGGSEQPATEKTTTTKTTTATTTSTAKKTNKPLVKTATKTEETKSNPQETVSKAELEKKVQNLTQNTLSLENKNTEKKPVINQENKENVDMEIGTEDSNPSLNITEENPDHFEPYDPTLELSNYEHPVLDLLEDYDDQKPIIDRAELESNKDQIIETLLNYKIEIVKIKATIGPTVTLYEIVPAPGVRISKIKNLEDDIALSLAALGIRIIAPIPGKGTIGIEVPNRNKQIVSLKEVLDSPKYSEAKMDLPIALGKTISNEVFVADLAKMPHLLIAGATGQGKSVGINTIIMSLLYKKHPSQLKLILIDPKKVELSLYNQISHHFLGHLPDEEEAIVTDTSKVVQTLYSLTVEMDNRYNLLKKASVRNLKEYNAKFTARRLNPNKGHRFLPYIVLIIDEFADLIMTAGKEVELPIGRLAQLARAVGIHLIIATQRPSVNIITGVIKANFPARLAFKVSSKIDSRTILDGGGAEQLIGRGDMLLSSDGNLIRVQCAFVDTPEVDRVIEHIGTQQGYPEPFLLPAYGEEEDGPDQMQQVLADLDQHFEDAARLVVMNQQGSTSMIQRRLKLGYNRAGRIMDQLEHTGIVGQNEGSKARKVYFQDEMELEDYLKKLRNKKNDLMYK